MKDKKKKRSLGFPLRFKTDRKARKQREKAKSGKASDYEKNRGRRWILEALKNCFCFSMSGDESRDIYVEFDELLASGEAYQDKMPQTALDLLERLEKAEPEFEGVDIPETDICFVRKRVEGGKGLLLLNGDRKAHFWSDSTLKKINFYDLYFEYLETLKEENADNARRLSQQSDEDQKI